MDTLVFTPKYFFYCFEDNIGNMAVTRKRPHRQRANMCHFVSYIMFFQENNSVQISPFPRDGDGGGGGGGAGAGRGSIAGPRSFS